MNEDKVKSLERFHTVRNARQLAGEVFEKTSELGVEIVEDEELISMRNKLQKDAVKLEVKMKELEDQMVKEEYRVEIRENRVFNLTADINLRKQLCNEMEAENRRLIGEKTEALMAERRCYMNRVRDRSCSSTTTQT